MNDSEILDNLTDASNRFGNWSAAGFAGIMVAYGLIKAAVLIAHALRGK